MRQQIFEYQVTGNGQFPFDMLRYDRAWPAKESEVTRFCTNYMTRGELTEMRVITLHGLSAPTMDRWRSFNWKVVDAKFTPR